MSSRIEKKSLSKIELRRSEREGMQAEPTLQMNNAFCCTASSWRAERTDKPTKEEQPYLEEGACSRDRLLVDSEMKNGSGSGDDEERAAKLPLFVRFFFLCFPFDISMKKAGRVDLQVFLLSICKIRNAALASNRNFLFTPPPPSLTSWEREHSPAKNVRMIIWKRQEPYADFTNIRETMTTRIARDRATLPGHGSEKLVDRPSAAIRPQVKHPS